MSHFHVGQKVVCVNADPEFHQSGGVKWHPSEAPRRGRVYTITGIHVDNDGDLIFRLLEIRRHAKTIKQWKDRNLGYWSRRFRPVRTTSIDCFTAMLVPAPRVREPA